MKKRGISGVIVTIIMVGLVLIAISISWTVIQKVIVTQTDEVEGAYSTLDSTQANTFGEGTPPEDYTLINLNGCEDLSNMNKYGSYVIQTYNSTWKKEGSYSIQITYPATNTSWKGFQKDGHNYGDISSFAIDKNYLQFWLYLEDSSLMTWFGAIDLGNAGDQRIRWDNTYIQENNLENGWNLVSLKFSEGVVHTTLIPDWTTADYFRMYFRSDGNNPEFIVRLDDIKIVSNLN